MSEERADPLLGSDVGGYRVEALLGEGATGIVYRALSPEGAPVALKLLRESVAADSVLARRFEREARTARRVSSPYMVPVLDTGEHEGIPFMCQPLFTGGSLGELLEREGRLAVAGSLAVCARVGFGLDALNAVGIVHRDVKTANVLLDDAGAAYITDFGLAKDRGGTVLTRHGQALGTVEYMAPEQIRAEEVTAATDVYGLGCVVFHCLTGASPFAGRRPMQIMMAQLEEQPPDPCRELPDASAQLGAAVLLALAKDPAERPPGAGDYARLLYRAAGLTLPEGSRATL